MKNQATNVDSNPPVDLSVLKDLAFGPDWTSKPAQSSQGHNRSYPRSERSDAFGNGKPRPRPMQRPQRPQSAQGPQQEAHGRPQPRSEHPRDAQRPRYSSQRPAMPARPEFPVNFYPQEAPFDALVQAMKTSGRTYQLFEIAALILEKPERWVAQVSFPEGAEHAQQAFYICVPDGSVFLSANQLWDHVLTQHLDPFFEKQILEVEAPKGNFPFVYRCSMTQVLIGPPNYHRYRELLEEHRNIRLPKLSIERVSERLEKVTDPEVIQAWVQKMSQREVYVPKERKPEDPETIDSRDDVRAWLEKNHKARLMKEAKTVRVHGKALQEFPEGPIRSSIEAALHFEKRFPLQTANHLRMRLRKLKFALYKKGSKGPSYVSAVKRKFRTPETVFSPSVTELIAALEGPATIELPAVIEKMLGLEAGALQTQTQLSPDQEVKRKQALQDLRWLVREGYVVEYSDAKLSIPPIMSVRAAAQEEAQVEVSSEAEAQEVAPVSEVQPDEPVQP
ncbi:MAG: hypothetical protein B7X06_02000 [Verrucomicrobia bacterium 21-51-4]|nr:MAG: hypothetical protein B7X06_02000 [Verrucomicrobia bacterium 21-51-4]HQU09160.1 hypothetical protein [Opitutales bacterium]